jgi:hypothetical protein
MRGMKIALLFVALTLACYSQTPGTAEAKGACSPANTGNQNTFNITCGIGKAQGDQMLKILNKILTRLRLRPTRCTSWGQRHSG